jgi:hypothetical protein
MFGLIMFCNDSIYLYAKNRVSDRGGDSVMRKL